MFERIQKFTRSISRLPDKKKYFELITAVLSIPVLLSVILLNYTNIQNQRNPKDTDTSPTPAIITIIQERDNPSNTNTGSNPQNTVPSNTDCIPEVGPVTITSPEAGETTDANPLSIIINQNDPNNEYCAIVWSYRIDGGAWSNFDDKDIYIYNLESGEKKLDVRVKSLISGDEETISRTFSYRNTQQVAPPTTEPTATMQPTATITPSPTSMPGN